MDLKVRGRRGDQRGEGAHPPTLYNTTATCSGPSEFNHLRGGEGGFQPRPSPV